MSRRANPKLVGSFILTAIGLLVAAALVFGSFTFFEVTRRFGVFFPGIGGRVDARFGGALSRGSARSGGRCRDSL